MARWKKISDRVLSSNKAPQGVSFNKIFVFETFVKNLIMTKKCLRHEEILIKRLPGEGIQAEINDESD